MKNLKTPEEVSQSIVEKWVVIDGPRAAVCGQRVIHYNDLDAVTLKGLLRNSIQPHLQQAIEEDRKCREVNLKEPVRYFKETPGNLVWVGTISGGHWLNADGSFHDSSCLRPSDFGTKIYPEITQEEALQMFAENKLKAKHEADLKNLRDSKDRLIKELQERLEDSSRGWSTEMNRVADLGRTQLQNEGTIRGLNNRIGELSATVSKQKDELERLERLKETPKVRWFREVDELPQYLWCLTGDRCLAYSCHTDDEPVFCSWITSTSIPSSFVEIKHREVLKIIGESRQKNSLEPLKELTAAIERA